MVAIVAGDGLGLFNASPSVLGPAGMRGQGMLGQAGGSSWVNVATGNLVLRGSDEVLTGRGVDLRHLRTYNSLGAQDDGDGDGWRWYGERTVALSGTLGASGSTVTRTHGDGHATVYVWNGALYISSEGGRAHDTLAYDSGPDVWVWTDGSTRLLETYAAVTGRLISQQDLSGNLVRFEYDSSGRLIRLIDVQTGQRLVLSYATFSGRTRLQRLETLALLTDQAGRPTGTLGAPVKQVEYGYDSKGRLASVTADLTPSNTGDQATYVTTYGYDGSRVTSVSHSDGTSATFTYYENDRVKTATDANGTQAFTYSASGTDVSFDTGDGSPKVWTYVMDGSDRLTEIKSPSPTQSAPRLSTRFQYDADGNLTRVVDAQGNSVDYEYDGNGNRLLDRDSQGNTVVRSYDKRNLVVTESHYGVPDPDGPGQQSAGNPVTTRFVYDSGARPRFTVTAEGIVREFRYGTSGAATGLLTQAVTYADGRIDVSGLTPQSALTEAQLTAWIGGQDKSRIELTEYSYDLRGKLSKQVGFATVNASGGGVLDAGAEVTEYIYDAHGDLLQVIAVRAAGRDRRTSVSAIARDGLGRVTEFVDAGGTSGVLYDDVKQRIQVTTTPGLVETSNFDGRGRLVSVARGDGATNRVITSVYDAAGRLRMTEDPQDGRRFVFYDDADRVRYRVDATGAVIGLEYNANGQLAAETQHHRAANTKDWYDVATKTVTKKSLTIGGSGSDVDVDSVNDRVIRFAYDDTNRLTTMTDATGIDSTAIYDGRSLVTLQQTGARVSRFFYDRDDRVVGVVDPLGFLTEYKYTAAGRLSETIRYSTQSPRATDVAPPEWVGVGDQVAVGGRPFEYRIPAADIDGDALTYRLIGAHPSWLSLETSTGIAILKGTPPITIKSYDVTVQADDQRGNTSDVTVRITVRNVPPMWATVPDRTVKVTSSAFTLTLPPAFDAGSTGSQLTYSMLSPLPVGLGFTAGERRLSGQLTRAGSYALTARVTDQQGSFTDESFILRVFDSERVLWPAVPVQQLVVGQQFTLKVPAARQLDGVPLTYRVAAKPEWLSFDTDTRVLSGTPASTGFASVVLDAVDVTDKALATLSFGLDVGDAHAGPIWAQLPPIAITAGAPASYSVPQATDRYGLRIVYSVASGLPKGLSIDPSTGSISGTTFAMGKHRVVLRAKDQRGRSTERILSLVVRDAEPQYNGGLIDREFISQGAPLPIQLEIPAATFTDPNHDTLRYRIVGMPDWLSFNPKKRIFTGAVPANQTRTTTDTVKVIVDDGRGGMTTGSFKVTVMRFGSRLSARSRKNVAETPLTTAPVDDVLAVWRPESSAGLHSYLFYDGMGRLVGSVDEQGFLTELVYEAEGNKRQVVRYPVSVTVASSDTLVTVKGRAGVDVKTTTVEFDDFGRVNRQVGVDGMASRAEYDEAGRLVRAITAAGSTEQDGQRASRIRFNAFGEITGLVSGEGEATLPANPTESAIDQAIAGRGIRYEYDSLGRRTRAMDSNGHATLFFYDSESRRTHVINAEREVIEMGYNAHGGVALVRRYANRVSPESMNGLTGGAASQLNGHLPATDSVDDQVSSFEYDRRGLLVKQTDGEGFVTTRDYDELGQLKTETRAISEDRTVTTRFDRDLRGAVGSQTGDVGGANLSLRTEYDAQGRVVRFVDSSGGGTSTTYADDGRVIEVTDPLGRKVRTEFDALGRVSKRHDASQKPTSYSYDDADRKVTTTSAEGVHVTIRRTKHGETAEVIDGEGGSTTYAYNKDGQLTKVTDASNNVIRENTYDDSGRLATTTDGRRMTVRLDYDSADRVRERRVETDDNLTTACEFNALGQTVKVTEGKGTSAELVTIYRYDRNGRLRQVVMDPDGLQLSTSYSYDGLGNTVTVEQGTVADPRQQVISYEFDKLGRKTKHIVAPSSVFGADPFEARDLTTEYRYDPAGRISRVIDPNGDSTWTVYDAAGQVTHVINAEGEVVRNSYDINGRLSQVRRYVNRLNAVTVAGHGDVADPVVPAAHANDQRSILVYDKDGRPRFALTAALDTGWAITERRYDANGNVTESRRYDKFLSEDRIVALDPESPSGISPSDVNLELAKLGYAGEETLKLVQRTRYAYHANNRLRFTVDALGGVTENVYDPMGAVVATVRYAARPSLSSYTQNAINAAVDRTHRDNQVTRFAYDTQGRLRYTLRVVDSDGDVKATKHLVTERAYDAVGRHTQTIQYETVVGALGDYRPVTISAAITTSGGDRRDVRVYDAVGREVYAMRVVTPGGQRKHLVARTDYDALSRVTQRTAYATTMGLADYSKAAVDATVNANKGNQDRTTAFVYDAAGRQRFQIESDGALRETVYDATGRVLESRLFDLKVDVSIERTVAALTELRGGRVVGDGVTRGERHDYDRVGRRRATTDAEGYVETNNYNGVGDRVGHIDKNGATCTYKYDRRGRVFRTINPAVQASVQLLGQDAPAFQMALLEDRTYYNALGNLEKKVERINTADARTTDFHYDTLGRLTSTFMPGYFDPSSGRVEKAPGGSRLRREIRLTYDTVGHLVRARTHTGLDQSQSEFRTYDRIGRLIHDIDARGHLTEFNYSSFGEQSQVTRRSLRVSGAPANGSHWTVAEIADKIRDASDPQARTITTKFDNAGRKTEIRQPESDYYHGDSAQRVNADKVTPVKAQAITAYEYNAFGEVRRESVKVNAEEWLDTEHYFDMAGRKVLTVDGFDYPTATEYDTVGNLTLTVQYAQPGIVTADGLDVPKGNESDGDRITRFTYDLMNRRTAVLRMGARYTEGSGNGYVDVRAKRDEARTLDAWTYDGVGNILSHHNRATGTTTFGYDALGQLIQIREQARALAREDAFTDPFGNTMVVAPVTDLRLDGFGQVVIQARMPGGSAAGTAAGLMLETQHEYDAAGNEVQSIDAMGNERSRRYDHAGRIIKDTQPISATMGDWMTNSHTLERRYAYDANGRQTDTIDVFKKGSATCWSGMHTEFNPFGEVKEERTVWNSPTAQGDAIVASFSYNHAGHVEEKRAADGVTRFLYNLAGQVTRREECGNSSTEDGTITRITETGYDVLGRPRVQRLPAFDALAAALLPDTITITPLAMQDYDRWGNVVGRTEGRFVRHDTDAVHGDTHTTTYAYDADDQVIAERLPKVTAVRPDTTQYDADLRHELRRDLAGRVVQEVDLSDAHSTPTDEATILRTRSRRFDEIGQLVSETDGTGVTTRYAYDAHGCKVGTRNALGHVFVDTFDKNGNLTSHGVVRHADSSRPKAAYVLNRFHYDQANRRVGTGETMSDSDTIVDSSVVWSFTKLDERGYACVNRDPMGHETSCEYDLLGNKTVERASIDPSEPSSDPFTQTWTRSSKDYTVGRLLSSKVGNRTTHYQYNEFGQLSFERQDDAGIFNSRTYEYKPNGWLDRVSESTVHGTPGELVGNRPTFRTSSESNSYEYTPKGQVARDHFSRSGSYEIGVDDDGDGKFERTEPQSEQSVTRTAYIMYDALGRALRVEAPPRQSENPGQQLVRVNYSYDELNNRRRIRGTYGMPWAADLSGVDKWYGYDAEGRATLIDGEVVNGQVVQGRGTVVAYDAIGRRWTADKFVAHRELGVFGFTLKYDQFAFEQYGYNDLNHLLSVDGREVQRNRTQNGIPQPDTTSSSFTHVETRHTDTRGALLSSELKIDGSFASFDQSVNTLSTFQHRPDGQLQQQAIDDRRRPSRSSLTTYFYDTAGSLLNYVYHQDGNPADPQNNPPFDSRFDYVYTDEFGGRRVQRIKVKSSLQSTKEGSTDNSYDLMGRLWHQLSDLPGESLRVRTFTYDANDRILVKTEAVWPTNGPAESSRQDILYAEGRQVAILGTGSLGAAVFSNVFTPISDAYPGLSPGSHLVRDGDTLAGIAHLTLGDSALWFLIAEANGLSIDPNTPLPPSERGKTYRIPNVVASIQNNDATFRPYSHADIIGDITPAPRPVPPPRPGFGAGDLLKVAALVAVAVIVTYATAALGTAALTAVASEAFATGVVGATITTAAAATAGNAASQSMAMAMGVQSGFSYRQLAAAGIGGAIGGFFVGGIGESGGVVTDIAKGWMRWQGQLLGAAIAGVHTAPEDALTDLGFAMAVGAGSRYIDKHQYINRLGGVDDFVASAFRPRSGWLVHKASRTWQNVVVQAVGAFTAVVVGAGVRLAHDYLNAALKSANPGPAYTSQPEESLEKRWTALLGGDVRLANGPGDVQGGAYDSDLGERVFVKDGDLYVLRGNQLVTLEDAGLESSLMKDIRRLAAADDDDEPLPRVTMELPPDGNPTRHPPQPKPARLSSDKPSIIIEPAMPDPNHFYPVQYGAPTIDSTFEETVVREALYRAADEAANAREAADAIRRRDAEYARNAEVDRFRNAYWDYHYARASAMFKGTPTPPTNWRYEGVNVAPTPDDKYDPRTPSFDPDAYAEMAAKQKSVHVVNGSRFYLAVTPRERSQIIEYQRIAGILNAQQVNVNGGAGVIVGAAAAGVDIAFGADPLGQEVARTYADWAVFGGPVNAFGFTVQNAAELKATTAASPYRPQVLARIRPDASVAGGQTSGTAMPPSVLARAAGSVGGPGRGPGGGPGGDPWGAVPERATDIRSYLRVPGVEHTRTEGQDAALYELSVSIGREVSRNRWFNGRIEVYRGTNNEVELIISPNIRDTLHTHVELGVALPSVGLNARRQFIGGDAVVLSDTMYYDRAQHVIIGERWSNTRRVALELGVREVPVEPISFSATSAQIRAAMRPENVQWMWFDPVDRIWLPAGVE